MARSSRVEVPPTPGFTNSASGRLVVPAGSVETNLNEANQRFLKLRETIDTDSLEASIQEAYLKAARTEENGVVRYKHSFDKEEAKKLAEGVMGALTYHLNFRHYQGLDEALVGKLETVKDANGKSLAETMVQAVLGVNLRLLEDKLTGENIDVKSVGALGHAISQSYHQRALVDALSREYGEDPEKYRKGLLDLNGYFRIAPKMGNEDLLKLGLKELTENYLQFLEEAHSKMSKQS